VNLKSKDIYFVSVGRQVNIKNTQPTWTFIMGFQPYIKPWLCDYFTQRYFTHTHTKWQFKVLFSFFFLFYFFVLWYLVGACMKPTGYHILQGKRWKMIPDNLENQMHPRAGVYFHFNFFGSKCPTASYAL